MQTHLQIAMIAIALRDTDYAISELRSALRCNPSPRQWGLIMRALRALV